MARLVRVPLDALAAGLRDLPRDPGHYLCVVHRLAAGDEFIAFDPELGVEARGRLINVERARVSCELSAPTLARRGSLGVTLLQATAKGDRIEQVVRGATALGVERIVLVVTERSVARPADVRRERLRTIAIEAARQSGRADLPALDGPISFAEQMAVLESFDGLKLCLSPESPVALAERLQALPLGSPAALLIGPEGGLSDGELDAARRVGFLSAALGPLVLRTELAALAALGCFAGRLAGAGDAGFD
ncbi:MAG TPA: RsmE family RNA methyltransferase [Polyangiaceae bacterium]|nr:RsmE family RNA methyltransferase [Polyangiaceae bacterium]